MRNSLDELPVLICMLRGGLIAGVIASLLCLPRRLYVKKLQGRRAKPLPLLLFCVMELAAAACAVGLFALSLLHANGGEPRLFAVCGFFAGEALTAWAVTALAAENAGGSGSGKR